MKLTRHMIVLLSAAWVLPLSGLRAEQSGGPPAGQEERIKQHHERAEKMFEALGLSDEQKEKMRAIGKEQYEAVRAIREDDTLEKEQKKEKMRATMQSFKERRNAVLTPEQQQKAEEMKEQFKKEKGACHKGDGPGAAPQPQPTTGT